MIVTGGGQVELKMLELGLEDVEAADDVVTVLIVLATIGEELEAELAVGDAVDDARVGDGEAVDVGEAPLDE